MQGRKWTVAWDPIKFSEGIINFYDWHWRQKAQDAYGKLQLEQGQSKKPLTQLTLGQQPMTRLKQEQGCWVDDVQRMGEPASPRVLVIMWSTRAVLSLSLSVSRIKRRAYVLRIGQSLHRLDKHTSALDWALQEVTEVVQVLARPPEGHPTSSSLAGSSHSSKDFRVGKKMPCHPPQLFLYASTQQPGCTTRDDVNTVERERELSQRARGTSKVSCVC